MGRWTQYDEDDYRLPEGFKVVGYDADVQTYFFKDAEGALWSSKERHGVMQPVHKKRREKNRDASLDQAAVDSDDEATLVYISDDEVEDEPRSLWTLYDNGQIPRAEPSSATTPKDTQSNSSFSFLPSSLISPAEPIGESAASGPSSPLRKHGFRNIARIVQSTNAFISDKVKNNLPTSVVDPDGSGWRQDEGSRAHSLKQADKEWEDLKRTSTMGSKKPGFSRATSSATALTRVGTEREKEKRPGYGKKSVEDEDDPASAKRAFSLRHPKGGEGGLGHTKSSSSTGPVMAEKKQHYKAKPSFPPAEWSTTPDPPRKVADAPRSTPSVRSPQKPKPDQKGDKNLPVPIDKSLPSSPHGTPVRNTTSTPANPSARHHSVASASIPQKHRATPSSTGTPSRTGTPSSTGGTPPPPPRDKGKQKASEDIYTADSRLASLPSVPSSKLSLDMSSLSFGSGAKEASGKGSTVKEGVLVEL